jgi:hypothetical protein
MLIDKLFGFISGKLSSGIRKLTASTKAAQIVFVLASLLYLGARISLTGAPAFFGGYPVVADVDDAYTYIESGVQTVTCFRQDCPAMEDLRQQLLVPSTDFDTGFERQREYQRAILYYHPLYSFAFAGLLKAGITPETGFNIMSILGAVLVNLAIITLLYVSWGPGGAAVALSMLAFSMLGAERGFRNIVPSHYALGFAIFSWAVLIKNNQKKIWIVPLCILGMLSTHLTGLLYAIMTLALIVLLTVWPPSKEDWKLIGWSAGVFALYILLTLVVKHPDLSLFTPSNFFIGAWSRRDMFMQGLWRLLAEIEWWGPGVWLRFSALILIVTGFIIAPKEKRTRLLTLAILLLGILAASLLYLVPFFPGVVTDRVWLPVKFFLVGALGSSIWLWLKSLVKKAASFNHETGENEDIPAFLGSKFFIFSLIVVFFVGQTYLQNQWINGTQYRLEVLKNTDRPFYTIDPAQTQFMLERIQPEDYALYMQEVPMYFYLSHGAIHSHTVSYRAVRNTPEQKYWIDNNPDIRFVVASHPVMTVLNQPQVALPVMENEFVIIRSENPVNPADIQLLVVNNQAEAGLINITYSVNGGEENRKLLTIEPNSADWVNLEGLNTDQVDYIRLAGVNPQSQVYITGIRIGQQTDLFWPWEQGISVTLKGAKDTQQEMPTLNFDQQTLNQGLDLPLRVLSDDSITVLAEVKE